MSDDFWYGVSVGIIIAFVYQWPIWTKMWNWLNKKFDEWANIT